MSTYKRFPEQQNVTSAYGRKMEWISVNDRLPEQDVDVILFDGSQVFCGNLTIGSDGYKHWGNQGCDGICYGWYQKAEITHWMPLPSSPEK